MIDRYYRSIQSSRLNIPTNNWSSTDFQQPNSFIPILSLGACKLSVTPTILLNWSPYMEGDTSYFAKYG